MMGGRPYRRIAVAWLGTMSLALALPAIAQDEPATAAAAIADIAFAWELADWGRQHRDGEALSLAARMLLDLRPVSTGALRDSNDRMANALLLQARALALPGSPLAARLDILAEVAADTPERGATAGFALKVHHTTIAPGGTWAIRFVARGGEVLSVVILATGRPFALTIVDTGGREVCTRRTSTVTIQCTLTPAQTGGFVARIANHARGNADFDMVTN